MYVPIYLFMYSFICTKPYTDIDIDIRVCTCVCIVFMYVHNNFISSAAALGEGFLAELKVTYMYVCMYAIIYINMYVYLFF